MNRLLLPLCLLAVMAASPTLTAVSAPLRPQQGGLASFPIPDEGATVYDENANGQPDLTGDTWVYDVNDDGRAELIIRFRLEQTLTAQVYDDTNANGFVDYALGDSEIDILEPYWRVRITARNRTWTLPNGLPDWNIDIEVDSGIALNGETRIIPTPSCPGENVAIAIRLHDSIETVLHGLTKVDGEIDLAIRVWDQDLDGVPDIEWHSASEQGKTHVAMVNRDLSLKYSPVAKFPPLGTILVADWTTAQIELLRYLIPQRIREDNYFILFGHPYNSESVDFGFENPFAYYDLQNDGDCFSELIIRMVVEDYDNRRPGNIAFNEVRYSWSGDGDNIDFRVYLIGKVYSSQVVAYPFYPVSHVDFQSLPEFVNQNTWLGASFAEYENPEDSPFAEGIYENLYFTPFLRNKLLSHYDIELPAYYPNRLLLREEYNFIDYNQKPRLYFSEVDRRLHLVDARQGIIIFSADTSNPALPFDFSMEHLSSGDLPVYVATTYVDSDSDGFVDTWTHMESGQVRVLLTVRPGIAVLADQSSLTVKRLPSGFKLIGWQEAPPATTAEWTTMRRKLEQETTRRSLQDLAGIFADLPGEMAVLANTNLQKISIQRQEFLGVVRSSGTDLDANIFDLQAIDSLSAGEYVLRGQAGRVWLEPVSQGNITIGDLIYQPDPGLPAGGRMQVRVENSGNVDASIQLKILAVGIGSEQRLMDETITLPAQGSYLYDANWIPFTGGEYIVRVQADSAQREFPLQVASPDKYQQAYFLIQPLLGVSIFLAVLLAGLLVGGWVVFSTQVEAEDESST